MEFKLNETQEIIRNVAKEIAEGVVAKYADQIEKEQHVPDEVFNAFVEAGLIGVAMPEEYGGIDAGHVALAAAVEEIGKVSVSAGSNLLVCATFIETVKNYGTEEQKQKYIQAGIEGKYRGAFAFTEPGTGSDPKQIKTTFRKEGDHYVLNGVKRFITNAQYEGPILIFARDENSDSSITGFIFDKFCEGYSISNPWDLVCTHGSPVYDVFMDNVVVPESGVFGKHGDGFEILQGTVAHSKVLICANFVGSMAASYAAAVTYAKEKMHRNQSIAKFQAIQLKIARIAARVEACRLLTMRLAEESDDHEHLAHLKAWVGMVKAHVSDEAFEVNKMCLDVLGPYGLSEEYKVERNLRDSLLASNVEGVSDMQRVICGSYILYSNDNLI